MSSGPLIPGLTYSESDQDFVQLAFQFVKIFFVLLGPQQRINFAFPLLQFCEVLINLLESSVNEDGPSLFVSAVYMEG